MVVVCVFLLFEMTLAAKGDHVVLNREIKILATHTGQFCLEHDVVLVFVDIDARTPRTARDSLIVERMRQVAGEKTIHFLLQRSQIAKRIITTDTHNSSSSSNSTFSFLKSQGHWLGASAMSTA